MEVLPGASIAEPRAWPLPDASVLYWDRAFGEVEADRLFRRLLSVIDWQQEEILIFGRRRPVPRLVAWHGDPGACYTYSGTRHQPMAWTEELLEIRVRLQALAAAVFNSVLLNLYRDGRDSMGWHSDDEPELGEDPVIASVSLGAARRFRMQHRRRKGETFELELAHGSLLLMAGGTQHAWRHCVPKTAAPVGERINLTFRRILAPGVPRD